VRPLQLLEEIQAAASRHRVIHDGDVPLQLAGELYRLDAVLGLADDRHVVSRREYLLETVAHHGMIICDKNSHLDAPLGFYA
jgi:hypothetical protein